MRRSGRQRDRVTLERAIATNTRGVQQRSWGVVEHRLPALVETATATRLERLFAVGDGGRIEGVQTHVVEIQSALPVQLHDRFVWHDPTSRAAPEGYEVGDRFLEVTAVVANGTRRDHVVCGCEERER